MQMLWHAHLGHVGFETVRRAAHTRATTGIDLTAHKIAIVTLVYVDRKSTSGAMHYFGEDLVHWTSKNQSYGSLSTAGAEFFAASSCA
jgi:hypothetical protein